MDASGKIGESPGSHGLPPPKVTNQKPRRARFLIVLFSVAVSTIVTLALLEIGLRLAGYPCTPEDLRAPVFVSDNGVTYHTRWLFTFDYRAGVLKQQFMRSKAPGVFRVALVGESSVYSLGQAPHLQSLLATGLHRRIEVVNFGFCGTGSDRVLLSVCEALKFDVDAVLVYAGHNEFSSHSDRSRYRQPGWLQLNCRLYQLLKPAWQPHPGRLYSESEKKQIYHEFHQNLEAIFDTLNGRGRPIMVWGTVSANLEAPPVIYKSELYDLSKLPPEPLAAHQKGMALLSQGRRSEARPYLIEAFSSSPRPMRATPKINEIIREVAAEHRIPLADVEQAVMDKSPDGIPGYDLFWDHCHLNERGQDILQEVFAAQLIPLVSGAGKTQSTDVRQQAK